MDCSVVIPVYFNQGLLTKTFLSVRNQLAKSELISNYEIIFVDDGSRDGSFAELLEIKKFADVPVRIIKLTRNFGQVPAIYAGYQYATGKCLITMSADLQDPAELIPQMLFAHVAEGCEIVICAREDRDESWYRKKTSQIFYLAMKKLSFPLMPEGGFDYVLLSERVKSTILMNREANPFWQGQILWTGFEPKFIRYTRSRRECGKSRWTLGSKIKYLLDGLLAYSYLPLRAMSLTGLLLSLLGGVYGVVIVATYFLGGTPFRGWAPIMILLLMLSGIQMTMLGIMGEYLWRALDQVRSRPLFLVDTVVE